VERRARQPGGFDPLDLQLGARRLLVDALPTSQPILRRFGFQHVADIRPCQWTPA
jgi:hypothetical protein